MVLPTRARGRWLERLVITAGLALSASGVTHTDTDVGGQARVGAGGGAGVSKTLVKEEARDPARSVVNIDTTSIGPAFDGLGGCSAGVFVVS
jgi:hypothetical protein